MRKLALALCVMLACSPLALAQDKKEAPKKPPTAAQKRQQERMKDCNEKAGAQKLEGDARKKFMSSCLRGEADKKGAKVSAQQEKMRACNKEASDKKMKGDERKKFVSECLKS